MGSGKGRHVEDVLREGWNENKVRSDRGGQRICGKSLLDRTKEVTRCCWFGKQFHLVDDSREGQIGARQR